MQNSQLDQKRFDELKDIVADVLGIESSQLGQDAGPDGVETWDSLAHLSIVTVVEEKFGVKFDMDEIQRIRGLSALAEALGSRLAA